MDNNGPMDQQEVIVNFNVQHTEAQRRMQEFQNSAGALEQRLVSTAGALANLFSFNNVQAVAVKSFDMAKSGINDMIKSMTTLQSSSGLTAEAFKGLQGSIRQAATETGNEFGNIGTLAKNLFDQTGLKEGLGEAVLGAQRMAKVFGSSDESFGKLAVKVTQFSGGITTANDMMDSFNKTTGITGTRMDAVLENMSGIADKIRNIAGGGASFGSTMKKNTEFTALMAAKFTEMGGNSQEFMNIQDSVLDPKKWSEISRQLPGMAKFLPQMIEAFSSGDVDKYAKFFQQKDTHEMGKNMGVIQKAASGFAFTTADIGKDLDFGKLKQDGLGAGTVLERSAKQIKDLGTQGAIFFTNIAASIMTWLGPIIETVSGWLSSLNAFLATSQGHFMSMTIGVMLAATAALSALLVFKRFFGFLISDSGKAGKAVGDGIGKGVEAASTGIASGIGNIVTVLSKNALQLLAIGAGFMMAGAGMWMLAEGIATIAKLDFMAAAGGLLILAAGLTVFLVAAAIMAGPWGWIAIGFLAAFGAALLLFGLAALSIGAGIKFASEGIEKIAMMGPKLASLNNIDFSGIRKLGTELNKFSSGAQGVYVKPKSLDSMVGMVGILVSLSESMDKIISAGRLAAGNGPKIDAAIAVITDSLSPAIKKVNKALSGIFFDTTISEAIGKSFTIVIDTFNNMPEAIFKMASFGNMLADGSIMASVDKGIKAIFGTGKSGDFGVFTLIESNVNRLSISNSKLEALKQTFDILDGIIPKMISMAALGNMMKNDSGMSGIRMFSKGLSTFLFETNAAANQLTDSNYSKIMHLPEMMDTIRNSLNTSLTIETKGSAEVAIQEHNSATSVHYSKVEKVLGEILTAVKGIAIPGPAKNPVGNAGQWHPSSMFSEESETF